MIAKVILENKRRTAAGRTTPEGANAAATSASEVKSDSKADALLRPPLKWAGGKRWLVPQLAGLWQLHSSRRYVEPFCGGLAVALGLRPNRAILNDINPHLINFYTHLQSGLEVTIEMRNDEKSFYRHRSRFNELIQDGELHSAESAQLFYYLNRTCFNGLCRFNQSGNSTCRLAGTPPLLMFETFQSFSPR